MNHLDSDQIAAYGERRLTSKEHLEVEEHLAVCPECRRDATAVSLAHQGERRRRLWLVGAPISLAAAAVIAGFFLIGPSRAPIVDDDQLRPGGPREGVATIEAWSPSDQVARLDSLRFIWAADGADALYRLTVTDAAGATLWNGTTSDTAATLPDSVRFAPGGRYHWYVDVLLSDGQRATTGLREFRVAP